MTLLPPLINGKSYEWADVRLNIMGTLIAGVVAINYTEGQDDMDGVHGAGRDFVSYGNGKLTKSGSITLKLEEVRNIMAVAPLGKIYDIPLFPIVITYTDLTLVTRVDTIVAKFKRNTLDTKSGDTSIDVQLPLFVASIIST